MQQITFTSSMNRTFKRLLVLTLGSVSSLFIALLWIQPGHWATSDTWVILGLLAFIYAVVLWPILAITYTFHEDHLYLRAGYLFTRIRYEDIESYRYINGLMDSGTGFNLLSSTEGIAILSQKVMLGEVKISPSNRQAFIEELEKRIAAVK